MPAKATKVTPGVRFDAKRYKSTVKLNGTTQPCRDARKIVTLHPSKADTKHGKRQVAKECLYALCAMRRQADFPHPVLACVFIRSRAYVLECKDGEREGWVRYFLSKQGSQAIGVFDRFGLRAGTIQLYPPSPSHRYGTCHYPKNPGSHTSATSRHVGGQPAGPVLAATSHASVIERPTASTGRTERSVGSVVSGHAKLTSTGRPRGGQFGPRGVEGRLAYLGTNGSTELVTLHAE